MVPHDARARRERRCITKGIPPWGFTLIEIMVVIGILGIVFAISVPSISRIGKKSPMRQAVSDVIEVCSHARARAILKGHTTEVIFHPLEKQFAVGGAVGGFQPGADEGSFERSAPDKKRSGLSGTLDDSISIEMLDVNLLEYRDQAVAVARFFPNGTCDEVTLVLRSDEGQWRMITFEITTGLAHVERDPDRFM